MSAIKLLIISGAISALFSFSNKSTDYKNDKPFRGFMIDAPRTVESLDYYFKLIDFLQ